MWEPSKPVLLLQVAVYALPFHSTLMVVPSQDLIRGSCPWIAEEMRVRRAETTVTSWSIIGFIVSLANGASPRLTCGKVQLAQV